MGKDKKERVNTEEIVNKEAAESVETEATQKGQTQEQTESVVDEKDELSVLKSKYDEMNDKYLRLYAEFDNYKKRAIKEKADLLKTASEKVLVDIIPFADDFERAIATIEKAKDADVQKAIADGLSLIFDKFNQFLTRNGVTVIETKDQKFDVDLHEAITTIPAPSEELKGQILDCVQKGYKLGDKVIRYPKVVVGA
jgi:molecular chaperone GrpE